MKTHKLFLLMATLLSTSLTFAQTNVTTTGGATNYIPKFTGFSTIKKSSIFDNGNVGIGTTTPLVKLTVESKGGSILDRVLFDLQDNNNVARLWVMGHTGGENHVQLTTNNRNSRITLMANDGSESAPRISFIGPEDVSISKGWAVLDYGASNTDISTAKMVIRYANTGGTQEMFGLLGNTEVIVNDPGEDVNFRVESDTDPYAFFVQGSDGNVGIGTKFPGEKLEVVGAIKATSFVGDGSGLTGIIYTETDPVFGSSASKNILSQDIANWNTAFGWGDHSAQGYINDGNTNWDNTYGFITASSAEDLTNKSGNISMWTNDEGYLTSYSENDPVFGSSAAKNILSQDIANWNTAFGWGDHSVQGYITDGNTNWDNTYGLITASSAEALTNKSGNISMWTNDAGYLTSYSETDPVFGASTASGITGTDITSWNQAFGWGDHVAAGYLTSYTETDPVFGSSASKNILSQDIANWNTAFGWGDHSVQGYINDGNTNWENTYGFITASSAEDLTNKSGNISMWTNDEAYLTSYSETDPVFGASTASGITGTDITGWNQAFGWGNHAAAGYLTSYTETDPIFESSAAKNILSQDMTNWNTAFGWGDHSAQGYINDGNTNWNNTYGFITASSAEDLTNKSGNISMWTNDEAYLTSYSETDPVFGASTASGITGPDITGWNQAFGWGNHAAAGYLTSYTETDPIFESSAAKNILSQDMTNWNTAFGWGDHSAQGYINDGNTNWNNTYGFITASSAENLTNKSGNISMWTNDEGYLKSYTETDPEVGTNTANHLSKWNGTALVSSSVFDNGNVGIGTTTPDEKLEVVGTIKGTSFVGDGSGLTGITATETDPIFESSAAKNILSQDMTNWNTAFGWGNHSVQGYINDGNTNWDNTYGFITASSAEALTNKTGNISMWTNDAGYLTSYTENDPKIGANTTNHLSKWNGTALVSSSVFDNGNVGIGITTPGEKLEVVGTIKATSFVGDGSGLTGITATETDPVFGSSAAKNILSQDIANWNTAFGWGNHSVQGYINDGNTNWDNTYGLITASSAEALTNKSGNISMWTNDEGYLKSYTETDPEVGSNTTDHLSKWNGTALVSSSVFDNGNVGIGTTTPGEKLEVNGSIKTTGFILPVNASDGHVLTSDASGNASWQTISGSGDGLWTANGDDIHYSTGNVGIGTTTPTAKLQVDGTSYLNGKVKIGGESTIINPYVDLVFEGYALIAGHNGSLLFGDDPSSGYGEWGIEYWEGGLNFFKPWDSDNGSGEQGFGNNFLFLKDNGNVGIGTKNPQSKLAVDGKITAKEVEVTLSGWSDFVFEDDYKLLSIDNLETYIEENNHLPDVPSESEVIENGVNLGEMDAILLQKIEELTLYVIEQNKRIEQLEKENKSLKN